jgi:hypothetical protein
MDYWAKAPLGRDQTLLFYPTLDQQVADDHPVRLLDEVLQQMDWSAWEGEYNGRMHIAETPFAVVKAIMGVRRFLLRGLENVRTEWRWVCTAYNLRKLVAAMAVLRAEPATTRAYVES